MGRDFLARNFRKMAVNHTLIRDLISNYYSTYTLTFKEYNNRLESVWPILSGRYQAIITEIVICIYFAFTTKETMQLVSNVLFL